MDTNIKNFDIIKHFKYETLTEKQKADRLYTYQVLSIDAMHTETGEHFVVYKSLYNGKPYGLDVNYGQIFIRPTDMFFSEVDHKKYPNIKQVNRFEVISNETEEICEWNEYDYKTICSPHERYWSIASMKDFKYCPYCAKRIKIVK